MNPHSQILHPAMLLLLLADGSQLTKLYGSEKLVPGAGPAEPGLTDVPAAQPRPIMPL